MGMKKLLMILALSLPLMAQEVEVKEVDGKTEVTVKKQHDKKKWDRGSMKRGGMNKRDKRMAMAKRNHMRKKRFWRSAVRVVVIGGVAYYVGYQQGMKKDRKGGMKRPIWNREDKK
jgi:hypothetical protein